MKADELKDLILQELLRAPSLSRQKLLEIHPCRPASMLNAVNELKTAGLVVEPERSGAKTGRRSPALSLNPELGAFAGLELQPRRLVGILLDGAGTLLARAALDFPAGITAQAMPGKFRRILADLDQAAPAWRNRWHGIGFADPGLVDVEHQKSLRAHNVPGWVPLVKAMFMETNPIPVKAAMAMMGICSDEMRLPMCSMTAEHQESLRKILKDYKLI